MGPASGVGGAPNDYLATYTYNTTTSTPPATGTFRLNNATPSNATAIYIAYTEAGGYDLHTLFENGNTFTGGYLWVQTAATRLTNNLKYQVTGAYTDGGTYVSIPITYVSGAGTVTGGTSCNVAQAYTGGRGIFMSYDTDCQVLGCQIDTTKQTGILGNNQIGGRNVRCIVQGCKVRNSTSVAAGGGNGIWWDSSTDSTIDSCTVQDVNAGNLVVIGDWTNLHFTNNHLSQSLAQYCRGIYVEDGINSPTTWSGLTLANNSITLESTSNNECIYMIPNAAITMQNVLVAGNNCNEASNTTSYYIFCDYTGSAFKIVNNSQLQGKSIGWVGHGSNPTQANNN
jgi:hypothetical protein